MKKITICITTHCVKTETRGQWVGIHNICPSAPSAKMIKTILDDFFSKSDITKEDCYIHIGFDKRKGRPIDEEYEVNLNELLKNYDGKLILNESDIDDPIETAPNNFLNVIKSVETEYYLLLEHDWLFTRNIPILKILDEMDHNDRINHIRFSQHDTVLNSALHNEVEIDPNIILTYKVSDNLPLLPSVHFSNNPYICRKKIVDDWWGNLIYKTEELGGFFEGPMNVFFRFSASKIGWLNTIKTYKCFVYGEPNDGPWVHHLNGNSWS